MTNEISTDVKSIGDTIKEKIQREFVGLIPDEQWTAMVQKEIKSFTDVRSETFYSGAGEKVSPFAKLVGEEIRSVLKSKISEEIGKYVNAYWGQEGVANAAIQKLFEQCAPTGVGLLLNDISQRVFMEIQNVMRSGRQF